MPGTLPGFQDFKFNVPAGSANPQFGDILSTLKTEPQSLTNAYSAYLAPLLAKSGTADKARVEQAGSADLAKLTSQFQRRGITGSSSEYNALGQSVATTRLNLETIDQQNAFKMADLLSQSLQTDITRNDNLVMLIAQAMGQELTSQRDMDMFRQQLAANIDQANKNRRASMFNTVIGGAAGIAGAYAGAPRTA